MLCAQTSNKIYMINPVTTEATPDERRADGAAIVERIQWCVGKISREFNRWDEPHAHGPGLYFVVEADAATAFTEAMGTNRWPVEDCASVFGSPTGLFEAAKEVAFTCDGAVIVHGDATINEELVRITQLSAADRDQLGDLTYADWMGTRHMSALETSTRAEILAVITLSEEDGRLTVFADGTFEDYPRDTLENERQSE